MSLFPVLQNLQQRVTRVVGPVAHFFMGLPAQLWVWTARLAWMASLVFLAILAFVQWIFVARLHDYQPEIERRVGEVIGQTVHIGHMTGRWQALNPGVVLDQLDLVDAQGRPSLSLQRVAAFLSWQSLLKGEPVLDMLVIDAPHLQIRRSVEGKISVAGFASEDSDSGSGLDALLALRRVRVQQAKLTWHDERRQAPELTLQGVNIGLDNDGDLHRLGIVAQPPANLASRLDVRAEWRGSLPALTSDAGADTPQMNLPAQARLYAEMRSAALAAWKTWVDYPFEVTEGRGGFRVWAEQSQGMDKLTVDVGVADLTMRLSQAMPEAHAGRLDGRFVWQRTPTGQAQLEVRHVQGERGQVSLPSLFPAGPLNFDKLSLNGLWRQDAHRAKPEEADPTPLAWQMQIDDFSIENADLAAHARGRYVQGEQHLLDLQGELLRGQGVAAWRYLPSPVGVDTPAWLKESLLAGKVSDGRFQIKGDIRHFPFMTEQEGIFNVTSKVQDAQLAFAPGWPVLDKVQAVLRFEQAKMTIEAHSAVTGGADLGPVEVSIPNLAADNLMLHIDGKARGKSADFLTYIDASPVAEMISYATRGMRAQGEGKLDLSIQLPLSHMDKVKVQGSYTLSKNEVQPLAALPPVKQVSGRIQFSEKGVHIPGLEGQWLGQPARFQGGGENSLNFVAKGGLGVRELRASLPPAHPLQAWLTGLSGQTTWRADIRIPQGKPLQWQVSTDLAGLTSTLPGPLTKAGGRKMPTALTVSANPVAGAKGTLREQWVLKTEPLLNGTLVFLNTPERYQFEKGTLALGGAPLKLPDTGLSLALKWPDFRFEDWQPYLDTGPEPSGKSLVAGANSDVGLPLPPPNQLWLDTERFQILGRQMDKVQIQGTAIPAGWQFALNAPDASGTLIWKPEGRGALRADLRRLRLTDAEMAAKDASSASLSPSDKPLPALDIRVADFVLGEYQLGKLVLQAENDGPRWRMPTVQVSNPDGTLTGDAVWDMARGVGKAALKDSTQLNFRLEANDIGRFMERLNFGNLVRKGEGVLSGKVSWQGRPSSLDYPSLTGNIRVEAKDGQFAKIESGAGRLIGLLSLQALPRRLFLDFKDVFSEGFAFDRIEGDLVLTNGVLKTREPLLVEGAAAQIQMQGETNLDTETQRLQVNVRPKLGSVTSLGAALVNPVWGLGSLLVQKWLKNPLDQVAGYQYTVTGTWENPQVNKD